VDRIEVDDHCRCSKIRFGVLSENAVRRFGSMFVILHGLGMFFADMFKSRRRLEAENLFLRHQLNIALRRAPPRPLLYGSDRALLVWNTGIWLNLLDLSQVVKPETILWWHRFGFKAFWRWKSRRRQDGFKIVTSINSH
jgi:hypothetical protein